MSEENEAVEEAQAAEENAEAPADEAAPQSAPVKDSTGPNQAEAWKAMMDSMTVFINASAKLMNTINQTNKQPGKKKCDVKKEDDCACSIDTCPEKSS